MTYEYAVSDTYYDKYSKAVIAKNLKGLQFNTLRVYNINPDESYKNFMTDMAALGVYVLVSASPDNDEYFGKYRYSTITKALGPDGKVTTSASGVKTVDQTETCYPALLLEYGKKVRKRHRESSHRQSSSRCDMGANVCVVLCLYRLPRTLLRTITRSVSSWRTRSCKST